MVEAGGVVGDIQGSGELENLDWIPIKETQNFELAMVTQNILKYAEDLIKNPPRQTASRQIPFFKHYGGGQTEVMLELPPGKHTLQLVLGNYLHILHNPPVVSEKITVTVE